MIRPLFVYGTLRDPDLLPAVLGRSLRTGEALQAVAPGFRAVHYPNRIYPALIRAPGGTAEGLALLGLSPFELDLLDQFEGSEYCRDIVPVMIGEELHEADAYLPVVSVAGSDPWTLDRWQAVHKATVLKADAAQADEIRSN
ncbi:MAG: gamma-glutamylcyclotransferase [Alphaproteobacteria bacterium]|nr:MAG: gamma-glutamylcyclotransferase [Alphaproteobacteria bacterium]